VPVDGLGEHPTGEQAHRAHRRCNERVHADRLGLLARLGKHRDDHARDNRGVPSSSHDLHAKRKRMPHLGSRASVDERRACITSHGSG
jgi:hypothetical protein